MQLTKGSSQVITTMSAINHPEGAGCMQLIERSKTGKSENKKIGK